MGSFFKDVKGQKKVTKILTSHLVSGDLAHAYLFIGKEGTGKEFVARQFARYILCGSKQPDDCENCKKFNYGSHPDFYLVEGGAGIKIEDVRQAIERVNLSPSFSARKVLLMIALENVTPEAANALLKTIEEPPADTVIIMTTRSEKKLPATIISRSQVIKFNKLTNTEIKAALEKKYDEASINEVLRLADGSVGEAISYLENIQLRKDAEKVVADVERLFNSESLIERYKIIETYDKNKNIKDLFNVLMKVVFSALAGASDPSVGISAEVTNGVGRKRLVAAAKKTLKIYSNLNYNVSLRIALEELVLEDLYNVQSSRG